MMPRNRPIALFCRIARGGFSGERVIQVPLPDGQEYRGMAPRHYCWTGTGRDLGREEPDNGQSIEGLVAARWLEDAPDGRAIVTGPDGEVLRVAPEQITQRPAAEPTPNVPV
jgi:hypothetical protein